MIGGPAEPPELYDLESDPGESTNVRTARVDEGARLFQDAIEFLEACGAAEELVRPRRESLRAYAGAG